MRPFPQCCNRHTACFLWCCRWTTHCCCIFLWRRWAAWQCGGWRGSGRCWGWCIPSLTLGTPCPPPWRRPAEAAERRRRSCSGRPGPSAGEAEVDGVVSKQWGTTANSQPTGSPDFVPLWAWCHYCWWCCCTQGGAPGVGGGFLVLCPRRWSESSRPPLSSSCLSCRQ